MVSTSHILSCYLIGVHMRVIESVNPASKNYMENPKLSTAFKY